MRPSRKAATSAPANRMGGQGTAGGAAGFVGWHALVLLLGRHYARVAWAT